MGLRKDARQPIVCIYCGGGVFMYDCTACRCAKAYVKGGPEAPELSGEVRFYQKKGSVLVVAELSGLPQEDGPGFFALHIHAGGSCCGAGFPGTGSHYDPAGAPHPRHEGDLPPLLLSRGGAYMAVRTDRFRVEDILGRTVVIHRGADDFTSQPAGNAGEKIACGVIRRA